MQNLSSLSQLTDDDIITYGSNLTIAEYNALLNSKRDGGLHQLISSLNLSLRNTTVNNLAAMFPIQRQKTPTIYNTALQGLRYFLQRLGDYESLLALHPQAPIQCPSANITYIPLYYKYRFCPRGSILYDSSNHAVVDIITSQPIRCLGDWSSYSNAERLNAAMRKQHESIEQHGSYISKCPTCIEMRANNISNSGCAQHQFQPRLFNSGNIVENNTIKTSLSWSRHYSSETLVHQRQHAYQMTPEEFEILRNRLVSSGKKEDFTYWVMILIASHLFLRGEEVCNILLCNIYIREIVFEDGYPWLVKRFILGVKRKGGSTTNFQISREDDFPKLCIIRNLLIYVHCVMCDLVVNDRSPLFASVCNPNRAVSKYTFGRVLKCLSCELFDTNDVRGLTCHSMRNFGYVLSCWGDGNVEDAIFDADHSPCSKSYQLYTRDTLRVYDEWKQNSMCSTAVNVLVPRWKKKKMFGTVRFRGRNQHTLRVVASKFVCCVLGVDNDDPSYKNSRFLLRKAMSLNKSSSNLSIIHNFISQHGSREEQSRVFRALYEERKKFSKYIILFAMLRSTTSFISLTLFMLFKCWYMQHWNRWQSRHDSERFFWR